MVNLISIAQFRQYVPLSNQTDESLIAASINQAQVALVPELFSIKFYNELIKGVEEQIYNPILEPLAPVLACFAASNASTLAACLVLPSKYDRYNKREPEYLSNHYINKTSSYLRLLYAWCDENNIPYTPYKSTSFCSINLSGSYGRYGTQGIS